MESYAKKEKSGELIECDGRKILIDPGAPIENGDLVVYKEKFDRDALCLLRKAVFEGDQITLAPGDEKCLFQGTFSVRRDFPDLNKVSTVLLDP